MLSTERNRSLGLCFLGFDTVLNSLLRNFLSYWTFFRSQLFSWLKVFYYKIFLFGTRLQRSIILVVMLQVILFYHVIVAIIHFIVHKKFDCKVKLECAPLCSTVIVGIWHFCESERLVVSKIVIINNGYCCQCCLKICSEF